MTRNASRKMCLVNAWGDPPPSFETYINIKVIKEIYDCGLNAKQSSNDECCTPSLNS